VQEHRRTVAQVVRAFENEGKARLQYREISQ